MSWGNVALGDICDLQNGYAFKSSDYVDTSNTLSCRMSNIRPGGVFDINYNARYLPDDFIEKHKQFLLKDGDVIIAMTDLADAPKILGVPTVVETNGKNILLNQRVGKLVIKNENYIHFPYLKLALNYPKVRSIYKRFAGGGLQINLGKADLLSVEIPLPYPDDPEKSLKEQKRIAAILDKADGIRRKRQQAIQLADDFLRSVFLDMFGDPVTNPKGWEVKTLKELAIVTTGNTPPRKEEENYGDYIEWIKSDNINTPSHFLTPAIEYLSEKGLEISRPVAPGSTLVTCIAGSFDCIGNAAYVDRRVTFNQQINALTPKKGINSWFLYALILFSKKNIQSASTNSMKGMVSKGKMEEISMIFPPVSSQESFELQFFKLMDLSNKMSLLSRDSLQVFNSLSQKAFNGEL